MSLNHSVERYRSSPASVCGFFLFSFSFSPEKVRAWLWEYNTELKYSFIFFISCAACIGESLSRNCIMSTDVPVAVQSATPIPSFNLHAVHFSGFVRGVVVHSCEMNAVHVV